MEIDNLHIKWMGYVEIVILVIFVATGLYFVGDGFLMSQQGPRSEVPLLFSDRMLPEYGPPLGTVNITMKPTEAFVVGDNITADVEVHMDDLQSNESNTTVDVRFIDCLVTENTSSYWYAHYDWMIELRHDSSMPTRSYRGKAFLVYTHEGVFGVNVTVHSPYSEQLLQRPNATLEGAILWGFPGVVTIKSYNYVEQRINSHLTMALTYEILGFTIIAAGPAVAAIFGAVRGLRREDVSTSTGNPPQGMQPPTGEESAPHIQKLINMVDNSVKIKATHILTTYTPLLLILLAVVPVTVTVTLTINSISVAERDALLISLVAVCIALGSLGTNLINTIERLLTERYYKDIIKKNKVENSRERLVLRVLVSMKVKHPQFLLSEARSINDKIFSEKELLKRLYDPSQN